MKRLLWWAGWGCSLIILIDLGQAWYIASHGIDWGVYREFDRSFVFGSTVPLIEPWFNLVLIIGAAVWLGQQTHAARRDEHAEPRCSGHQNAVVDPVDPQIVDHGCHQ